jgi:hypothetical protein
MLPATVNSEPSNNKLASPFKESESEKVATLLSAPFATDETAPPPPPPADTSEPPTNNLPATSTLPNEPVDVNELLTCPLPVMLASKNGSLKLKL